MMRSLSLLVALTVLPACAKKLSPDDARGMLRLLDAVARVPVDQRARILYVGCSELPGCAQGCKEALEFCGGSDTDPSQRAAVLASCGSVDYRARRDKGEALSPDVWIVQHVAKVAKSATPR